MEDSIRLGQYMIVYRNILQLKKDPRIVQAGNEKTPKYVVPAPPQQPMTDKGIYMVMEQEGNDKYQYVYLGLVIVAILACMCFRLWPLWLKKGIWYISFYLLVFLVVTAIFRVILWGLMYHFGFEIWLFPNYWIDSNDPRDSFLPVWSAETRDDMFEFRSIIFRLISGSLIVYMGYQFCQDEKNVEDLKDLAQNGISDLFEYGQDFMIGNALGDGKPKNNTENPAEKSF
jgi:translocation protein SEC62